MSPAGRVSLDMLLSIKRDATRILMPAWHGEGRCALLPGRFYEFNSRSSTRDHDPRACVAARLASRFHVFRHLRVVP